MDVEHVTYLALTTFRGDGTPVTTSVGFVRDGDTLLVQTGAASGKVRRIRASSAVTVSACDVRGRVTGPVSPATAGLVTDPLEFRALVRRVRARYGLVARLIGAVKRDPRVAIRITAPGHSHALAH
jgi:PPOX class probable F420-dependent enzyme